MEQVSPIFIFGSGAQGRVVRDIVAVQYPNAIVYFVDDNTALFGTFINDTEVISVSTMLSLSSQPYLHIAIGNPNVREHLVKRFEAESVCFLSVIHPSAVIAPTAKVEPGSVISAGCIINTNAVIAAHCLINTGVIVEHDCTIEAYVSLSPGSLIGGRVQIGTKAFIASRAVVLARVQIGAGAIIGMGALVMKDVENNTMHYGSPAKWIADIDETYNWSALF
jgi:acetyltransferase EpsM